MMPPPRRTLEVAMERRNWELAALCLLNGIADAARSLPPEALDELLDLLAGIDARAARAARQRRTRERRH